MPLPQRSQKYYMQFSSQSTKKLGSAFGIFFSSLPDGNIVAFKPVNIVGGKRDSAVQSPRAPVSQLSIFTARLGVNILSLHIQNDETIKFSPIIVEPTESFFGNSKQAIATTVFIGGVNAENDSSYRARILSRVRAPCRFGF